MIHPTTEAAEHQRRCAAAMDPPGTLHETWRSKVARAMRWEWMRVARRAEERRKRR